VRDREKNAEFADNRIIARSTPLSSFSLKGRFVFALFCIYCAIRARGDTTVQPPFARLQVSSNNNNKSVRCAALLDARDVAGKITPISR